MKYLDLQAKLGLYKPLYTISGISQCDPIDDNIVMLCSADGSTLMSIDCSLDGKKCLNGECAASDDSE